MYKEMKDMCCVVTGGTRGIGAAIAKRFAKEGACVALLGRNEEKGREVIEEIERDGGCAHFYCSDVTNREQIGHTTEDIIAALGHIDVWVNAAGVSKIIPFLEMSEEDWDVTLDTNLKGIFLCCQVAIRDMMKTGHGNIINISSISGKKASAWQTAYCASKFGVQGLTQSIAKEFADKGIRVNAICPGAVDTDIWNDTKQGYARKRGIDPDDVLSYFIRNNPMKRLAHMKDITDAAMFLASDRSSYMTGQSIILSGGEIMD